MILKKKCYIFYVVPNCCWTPNPKFHVLIFPFSLVAGPQKIWTVTLNQPNKHATGGNIFFDFLKAKNEEIFQKIFIFTLYCTDQKSFAHFWKIKTNTKQFFSSLNFLFVVCSLMQKEGFCK